MIIKKISSIIFFVFILLTGNAQKISYSTPDRDDIRSMDFEIIGKMNDHFLIYKSERAKYYISVFDNEMKTLDRVSMDFLPDKIINEDIIAYKDFFYFIYQYQRRNILYCMAAKIGADGKIVGDPIELDTTAISFAANNKIYTVINSEDKQKIDIVKINSRNADVDIVSASLFNSSLEKISKSQASVPMPSHNDFLTELMVDNEGELAMLRAVGSSQNDNINSITLITKAPFEDTLSYFDLKVNDIYLDNIRIKVDNINRRYLITSFYSKQKRGNIDGLFCMLWDKNSKQLFSSAKTTFSDELRSQAKNQGNIKAAFNDFYLQQIVMRRDGGFVIASESVYTSSRGNYNNRWDYFNGSPYLSPYSNYYYYNNPLGYYYPWYNSGFYNSQINRYYADNIAIMSFDSSANMRWANVIAKSQYDDNSDNFIGYGTMNTGSEVHFLFNEISRRTLILTDQSVTPDGQLNHEPTLHNLDRDYQFMPQYIKQVGSRQVILPCQFRNYVVFAKIEF